LIATRNHQPIRKIPGEINPATGAAICPKCVPLMAGLNTQVAGSALTTASLRTKGAGEHIGIFIFAMQTQQIRHQRIVYDVEAAFGLRPIDLPHARRKR
jgi:hypothetical protein